MFGLLVRNQNSWKPKLFLVRILIPLFSTVSWFASNSIPIPEYQMQSWEKSISSFSICNLFPVSISSSLIWLVADLHNIPWIYFIDSALIFALQTIGEVKKKLIDWPASAPWILHSIGENNVAGWSLQHLFDSLLGQISESKSHKFLFLGKLYLILLMFSLIKKRHLKRRKNRRKKTHTATKFSRDPVWSRHNSIFPRAFICKFFVLKGRWRKHAFIGASQWHNHLCTCLKSHLQIIVCLLNINK